MKVKALRSFVGTTGDGQTMSVNKGSVFALPAGVDWLEAGFVEPIEKPKPKRKPTTKKK